METNERVIEKQIIAVSPYLKSILTATDEKIKILKNDADKVTRAYLAGAGFNKVRYQLRADFNTIIVYKEERNEQ